MHKPQLQQKTLRKEESRGQGENPPVITTGPISVRIPSKYQQIDSLNA